MTYIDRAVGEHKIRPYARRDAMVFADKQGHAALACIDRAAGEHKIAPTRGAINVFSDLVILSSCHAYTSSSSPAGSGSGLLRANSTAAAIAACDSALIAAISISLSS